MKKLIFVLTTTLLWACGPRQETHVNLLGDDDFETDEPEVGKDQDETEEEEARGSTLALACGTLVGTTGGGQADRRSGSLPLAAGLAAAGSVGVRRGDIERRGGEIRPESPLRLWWSAAVLTAPLALPPSDICAVL